MNTITKTSAQAVSRKLRKLNFEPYDYASGIGCSVWQDGERITVANHGYLLGTASMELKEAGYIIENLYLGGSDGRFMETFTVAGRVEA